MTWVPTEPMLSLMNEATYPNGLSMGDAVEPSSLKVGDRVAVWEAHGGQFGQGEWYSATVTGFRDYRTAAGPQRQPLAKLDAPRLGESGNVFVYRARSLA